MRLAVPRPRPDPWGDVPGLLATADVLCLPHVLAPPYALTPLPPGRIVFGPVTLDAPGGPRHAVVAWCQVDEGRGVGLVSAHPARGVDVVRDVRAPYPLVGIEVTAGVYVYAVAATRLERQQAGEASTALLARVAMRSRRAWVCLGDWRVRPAPPRDHGLRVVGPTPSTLAVAPGDLDLREAPADEGAAWDLSLAP